MPEQPTNGMVARQLSIEGTFRYDGRVFTCRNYDPHTATWQDDPTMGVWRPFAGMEVWVRPPTQMSMDEVDDTVLLYSRPECTNAAFICAARARPKRQSRGW